MYGTADPRDRWTAVIPLLLLCGRKDGHGRIRFKKQEIASIVETEIDAAIIQAQRGLDRFERGHRAFAEHACHIFQELRVLGAVFRESVISALK